MNKYRSLVKSIAYLLSSVLALTIIVFAGIYLYNSNPQLFIKEKMSVVDWQPTDVETEVNSGSMTPHVHYWSILIAET